MKQFLTAVLIVLLFNPIVAHAYESEVDPQVVAEKRAGYALRWLEVRRELRRIARQAEWLETQQDWFEDVEETPSYSGRVVDIIHDIFGVHGDQAVRVADCESGLDPSAANPSGASGLFQLMPGHWEGRFDPFDPVANTRYAYDLSNGGTDWSAWAEICRP